VYRPRMIAIAILVVFFTTLSGPLLAADDAKKSVAAKPAPKSEARAARFYASLSPADGSLINNPNRVCPPNTWTKGSA